MRVWQTFTNTISATQVFEAISLVMRKNITAIFIFRLRNRANMEAWLEELSALCDKDTLIKRYRISTEKPFGCSYINVAANDKTKHGVIQTAHHFALWKNWELQKL